MLRKENKGFSMIELVVVLAIMAVLVGAGATFTGLIPASRLKECVKNTTSMIESTRTNALSYSSATLEISRDDDGIYAKMVTTKEENVEETKTVGYGAITVEVEFGGNGTYEELKKGDRLTLTFTRAGSFGDATFISTSGKSTSGEKCTHIRFSYGSRSTTLKLVTLTGKVTTE